MTGQQPPTSTEAVVARAWCAALDLPEVGSADNFFDLGGHSVLMHAVQERLVSELGRDVDLLDLFRHPTVRAIAAHLDDRAGTDRAGTDRAGTERAGTDRVRGRGRSADLSGLRSRRTRRGTGASR